MRVYYHGGKPGLKAGELLVPSPPHKTDGCPICVARSEGKGATVGEYRSWLRQRGPAAQQILDMLGDAPDDELIDPPTAQAAVYFTTERDYARWYAARSGHGDLYEVEPVGDAANSDEDHFTTYYAPAARVTRVLERRVWLRRNERRDLLRRWKKADRAVIAARVG